MRVVRASLEIQDYSRSVVQYSYSEKPLANAILFPLSVGVLNDYTQMLTIHYE